MAKVRMPGPSKQEIVVTELMTRTANRTLGVHPVGGLVVWTGLSRLGKTTTARWLVRTLKDLHDPNDPNTFRAKHYEVGEIPKWAGHNTKKAVRSLYHATIGNLDEGTYRQSPSEDLAAQLVRGLKRKDVEMILVDEAGLLSLEAIRGMVLACDTAENFGWTLTIVFIGMDKLPQKVRKNPQVDGRVHQWCYFEEYGINCTWDFLAKLHPHFGALDGTTSEGRAQVEFVHKICGGVPGKIVPFLHSVDNIRREVDGEITLRLLQAAHMTMVRDRQRAVKHSKKGFDPNYTPKVDQHTDAVPS